MSRGSLRFEVGDTLDLGCLVFVLGRVALVLLGQSEESLLLGVLGP